MPFVNLPFCPVVGHFPSIKLITPFLLTKYQVGLSTSVLSQLITNTLFYFWGQCTARAGVQKSEGLPTVTGAGPYTEVLNNIF